MNEDSTRCPFCGSYTGDGSACSTCDPVRPPVMARWLARPVDISLVCLIAVVLIVLFH